MILKYFETIEITMKNLKHEVENTPTSGPWQLALQLNVAPRHASTEWPQMLGDSLA